MKQCKQPNPDHSLRKSFAGLGSDTIEEYDSSAAAVSDLFHGFLAIGTMGSENRLSAPSTPTFPSPVENITEKDTEVVTETKLKLINDELEKVLAAEAKDDILCTSGRTSHVSTGRSSQGSSITLGARESTVCPLQDFLFGSKCDAEGIMDKEVDRSAVIPVKEKLKKILRSSALSRNSTSGVKNDSISPDKTMNKILHVFHRKIHPDTSAAGKKLDKQQRKKKHRNNKGCKGVDVVIKGENIVIDPQRDASEEQMQQSERQCSPPNQFNFKVKESSGNRECWIKTDADCKLCLRYIKLGYGIYVHLEMKKEIKATAKPI